MSDTPDATETRRPAARVFVVLARRAPVAAIFRRGPSRWTLVLRWKTDTDEFEVGDWFRGSFYTHRCDLTPNGQYLVYFAASFGSGLPGLDFGYSWSGVSRLPSLTPLARWEKDDCWFGGGLFDDDYHLSLNERSGIVDVNARSLFAVSFDPDAHGEDDPIYSRRLDRDGWRLDQAAVTEYRGHGFTTPTPEIRTKPGRRQQNLRVSRVLEGFKQIDTYTLVSKGGAEVQLDADWADWDLAGRLVYASEGCLYAASVEPDPRDARLLIDLNGLVPGY